MQRIQAIKFVYVAQNKHTQDTQPSSFIDMYIEKGNKHLSFTTHTHTHTCTMITSF